MSTEDEEKGKDESKARSESDAQSCEALLARCYEICINGQLDSTWSDWFEGFEMHPCGENWTVLCGHVADQAALLGILNKLCRLNLPLVSVNEVARSKRYASSEQEGGG
jgi:hypothetical protein